MPRIEYTCTITLQHSFFVDTPLDDADKAEMERLLQENPQNVDGILECIPKGTFDHVCGIETWYGDPEITCEEITQE
jgi:hypothetical protein